MIPPIPPEVVAKALPMLIGKGKKSSKKSPSAPVTSAPVLSKAEMIPQASAPSSNPFRNMMTSTKPAEASDDDEMEGGEEGRAKPLKAVGRMAETMSQGAPPVVGPSIMSKPVPDMFDEINRQRNATAKNLMG